MTNQIEELKEKLQPISSCVQNLRKESANSLCGPCPVCGGDDRFFYKIDKQRFGCRQCHPEQGDIIDFHAWVEGVDTKELFKKYLPGSSFPKKTTYKKTKPFEHFKLGFPVGKYPYTDANGRKLYYNCRFEPKQFRQCDPSGLKWSTKDIKPKVLYNLPRVIEAETIFIVEGEKDVHSLAKLNLVGTCNVGGAGNWTSDLNKYFKDKEIYLVPDNDDPGRKHIEKVFQNLNFIKPGDSGLPIKVIELPGLAEGGDFSDWLDILFGKNYERAAERFALMVDGAEPYVTPENLKNENDQQTAPAQFEFLHNADILKNLKPIQ